MDKRSISAQGKKREVWIDNIKVFACILVVLGHFFQSIVEAQIISESAVYLWFNKTIYYFHVPLFFICSGYLFQKYSKVNTLNEWKMNVIKKAISLGIPYFAFSTLTWLLKTVFSGTVNTKMSSGLLHTLFMSPTSPYWYLYCLFFVFLLTPTFKDKRIAVIAFGIALIAKAISIFGVCPDIYAVSTVFANGIWFIIGMCFAVMDHGNVISKSQYFISIIIGVLFLILSVAVCYFSVSFVGVEFFLGILACVAIVGMAAARSNGEKRNPVMSFLSPYTMPIFLLHTIFAAPVRILLLKLDIYSPVIHIILGIAISIFGPIVAAVIMKRVDFLNFFLYPGLYIKIKRSK